MVPRRALAWRDHIREVMELHLLFARIEPTAPDPVVCPRHGCDGTQFRRHQQVTKAIKDPIHQALAVSRYQCLRCGRTFRAYPPGVTRAHTSRRVQELATLLYLLGLSLSEVALALDEFGIYLSRSRVHAAVQQLTTSDPRLMRQAVFQALRRGYAHRGVVDVLCLERWLRLTLCHGEASGLILNVSDLSSSQIIALQERLQPLSASLGGQIRVVTAMRGAPGIQAATDHDAV